jgi:hypothetical protein
MHSLSANAFKSGLRASWRCAPFLLLSQKRIVLGAVGGPCLRGAQQLLVASHQPKSPLLGQALAAPLARPPLPQKQSEGVLLPRSRGCSVVPASQQDGSLGKADVVKRRTPNASTDVFGTLDRSTTFMPWRPTSVRLLGLGLRLWLRIFLLSPGLSICLCRLGVAWLGLAPGLASVVGRDAVASRSAGRRDWSRCPSDNGRHRSDARDRRRRQFHEPSSRSSEDDNRPGFMDVRKW